MKKCSNCNVIITDKRNYIDKCSPCYFVQKAGKQNLIKVYEAGPIEKEDSRHLSPSKYNYNYNICNTLDELYNYLYGFTEERENINNKSLKWLRTGPWSLSCDHGCSHSISTFHGLSPNGCFPGNLSFTRKQIKDIALSGVNNAQVIVANITKNDAYGTFSEIGYAIGNKKPVVFFFGDVDTSEMWFMIEMSRPLIDKIPANFWTQYPSGYANKEEYIKYLDTLALKYPQYSTEYEDDLVENNTITGSYGDFIKQYALLDVDE